jgi:hypothetical protein
MVAEVVQEAEAEAVTEVFMIPEEVVLVAVEVIVQSL